ncbi:GntR family transcriptional regulator [Microbacterium sp. Au-Mic1]|uniref:GntR family transcriptional regulator n=1 Tax=Microbacterium sp. Au-Mic1 TaxID=2906457 RepID=UPI001E3746DD|nr:GntR family transcriptional regulator [Microbacterium sp. Au-Mic1]MCE4026261.1 GntR family transcriptional regulator [Microbacterium sp. Au-Mic1]
MIQRQPSAAEKITRRNLGNDVYETVRSRIMNHAIAPGDRLNIDRLSRALNVSQTPIRQALARLESEGLVEKQPLIGYSATPVLTRAELEDLYGFRLLNEPWAAGRAAALQGANAQDALTAELASARDVGSATPDGSLKSAIAHDARFHELILSLAGNEIVRSALERTHSHLHLFRLYSRDHAVDTTIEEHEGIASAVVSGSERAALEAMRAHLESSRTRTIQALR